MEQARFSARVALVLDSTLPRHDARTPAATVAHNMKLGADFVVFFGTCVGAFLVMWTLVSVGLGMKPSAVTSNSMKPHIQRGDIVMFNTPSASDAETLSPGAVIRFRSAPSAVVHRIMSVDPERLEYRTKGDANETIDTVPVLASDIDGVGVLLVPQLGWPRLWLLEAAYAQLAAFMLGVTALLGRSLFLLSKLSFVSKGPARPLLVDHDGLLPVDTRARYFQHGGFQAAALPR